MTPTQTLAKQIAGRFFTKDLADEVARYILQDSDMQDALWKEIEDHILVELKQSEVSIDFYSMPPKVSFEFGEQAGDVLELPLDLTGWVDHDPSEIADDLDEALISKQIAGLQSVIGVLQDRKARFEQALQISAKDD